MLSFANFRLECSYLQQPIHAFDQYAYINFCSSCSISFFMSSYFFLSDVIETGSFQKGASWQSIAGNCSDPSIQAKAKQNLVQGFISVFGWDMGLLASNVKITCGKNNEKWTSILSAR